ncbi:hypothetical protein MmiAt1_05390 [Methanimicrococcus sp. At1]|uniref:DUF523 domain-containing protein n=1 Tax=Methanimicrococcus hacksteinii TaxID=3028293 RepID=A0ABU3VNK5_9EURY|nr:hypothetical protein [Methanimicrococcus sp. At1]MDV0444987.1 hypothetical protein [Methanimicrococcus sp. At1]
MNQKENIYVVAHCLLNPAARVKGIRQPSLFDARDKKIIQLPCPELIYAGPDRDKKAREDYDTPDYREFCRNLLAPSVEMIEMFSEEGYAIIIKGMPKSPSCGVLTTSVKDGNAPENKTVAGYGVFFEEIKNELNRRRVSFLMTE